jgi:hypothetical protein
MIISIHFILKLIRYYTKKFNSKLFVLTSFSMEQITKVPLNLNYSIQCLVNN